jgi:hypothetical protein
MTVPSGRVCCRTSNRAGEPVPESYCHWNKPVLQRLVESSLTAAVAVEDPPARWAAVHQGGGEGLDDQAGAQVIDHGVADDARFDERLRSWLNAVLTRAPTPVRRGVPTRGSTVVDYRWPKFCPWCCPVGKRGAGVSSHSPADSLGSPAWLSTHPLVAVALPIRDGRRPLAVIAVVPL